MTPRRVAPGIVFFTICTTWSGPRILPVGTGTTTAGRGERGRESAKLLQQLSDASKSGVYRTPRADDVLAAMHGGALRVARIDLAGAAGKDALIARLAAALEFPEWFGGNWDALEDCLTDLAWCAASGYVLILANAGGYAAAEPAEFETALEVLDGAAEYWYDEDVPFWVLVGAADFAQFDIPVLGEE